MTDIHLAIDAEKETKKIVHFLNITLQKHHMQNIVIGLSGGIDSMVSYYLLKRALPLKHIYPVHLPYDHTSPLVPKNTLIVSIKKPVDALKKLLRLDSNVRIGNIMARIRMVILYDFAKKHKALVCGTENKSEHLLGYFTRFGDAASDIEPIQHLYKTQVCQLAQYLEIPQDVIKQHPTADLWNGQTDEGEFGFTYEEADQVLYLYADTHMSVSEIEKKGFNNAKKIIQRVKDNAFKHQTPYMP